MVLGEIVGSVGFAGPPVNVELFLADTVAHPIISHVDCLGALLFDGVVGNSGGSAIVGDHGGGWLGVAEFFKADTGWTGFFGVEEEGSQFGFSRRGLHFVHNLAENVDGAVVGGFQVAWLIAEVMETACTGSCFAS